MGKETEARSSIIWRQPWFERVYRIGVLIKGIDGALELIAGFGLLLAPRLVHIVLVRIAAEFGEHHTRPFQLIAEYLGQVDGNLVRGGLAFFILFLIVHGIVKLALVYCLLKRIERAYPIALIILTAFLVYQVYTLFTHASIGMVILAILDALIIWLVWNEYQELKVKARKAAAKVV